MPIYEFECLEGHKVEKIFGINFCPKYIPCLSCMEEFDGIQVLMEKIWSIPGNIQIGAPTKVFINSKTGEVFTPFSKHDKPPIGYYEKELKSPIERSKFEKEQQRRADAENQLTSHVLDEMKSEARKKRHDNLKSRMNAVQREEVERPNGKKEVVEFTLDHRDKALLSKAMERSKKKLKKEKKTDVKFAVNHNNSSNLDQMK